MKRVFADTSYWIAVLDPRDAHSKIARKLATELSRATIVTSEFVFLEFLNAVSAFGPRARAAAVQLLRRATSDPRVQIVETSRAVWAKSVDLYAARNDKRWSLTDCTSFVIMQEMKIADALTSDGDFEQAGFVVLLRTA